MPRPINTLINYELLKKLYKKNRINLLRLCLAFWGFLLVSYPYKRFNDIEQYNTYNKEKNEDLEDLDIIEKCKESNTKYVNIFNEYDELINNTADFYKNTLLFFYSSEQIHNAIQFIHGIIFNFDFSFFVILLINSNLCS